MCRCRTQSSQEECRSEDIAATPGDRVGEVGRDSLRPADEEQDGNGNYGDGSSEKPDEGMIVTTHTGQCAPSPTPASPPATAPNTWPQLAKDSATVGASIKRTRIAVATAPIAAVRFEAIVRVPLHSLVV